MSTTSPADGHLGDDRAPAREQRAHLRFDKMFTVRLESLLFGEIYCVARNVSAGGIFLELPDPLPPAQPTNSAPSSSESRFRSVLLVTIDGSSFWAPVRPVVSVLHRAGCAQAQGTHDVRAAAGRGRLVA